MAANSATNEPAPPAPPAPRTQIVCIVDPHSGALTVEGMDAPALLAVAGDLLPPPYAVNCARPATAPATGVHGVPATPAAAPPAAPPAPSLATGTDGRETLLRIARIYHGSVVDGPGRRSVVQVQGCPIRCPGCYVPETHDPAGGVALPVDQVIDAVLDPAGAPRDGVTVLGGEPFAQAGALAALLRRLKAAGVHTTVYSGYTLDVLRGRTEPAVRKALALTDLLVDGPFVAALSDGAGEWRGSRNQRLLPAPLRRRVAGGC